MPAMVAVVLRVEVSPLGKAVRKLKETKQKAEHQRRALMRNHPIPMRMVNLRERARKPQESSPKKLQLAVLVTHRSTEVRRSQRKKAKQNAHHHMQVLLRKRNPPVP